MAARTDNLHLDLSTALGQSLKGKHKPVADSWEDEDVEMSTPTAPEAMSPTAGVVDSSSMAPNPPPPTPISPTGQPYDWSAAGVLGGGRPQPRGLPGSNTPRGESDRRPEKTTAAASRMIAAGLGVRAPKKTEEQRQYDRAMKEQEIRRKAKEKEDREKERLDDEKAKAAVWDS